MENFGNFEYNNFIDISNNNHNSSEIEQGYPLTLKNVQNVSSNISNTRQCFITYQTQRRELKIRRVVEYFRQTLRFLIVMKHCNECLI